MMWLAFSLFLARGAAGDALERVSWLAGGWRGEMGDVVIEEHWIPSSVGMMLGLSQSISGTKVVEFEVLRIEARGNDLFYVAQPSGRPGVEFELVEWSNVDVWFNNEGARRPRRGGERQGHETNTCFERASCS